MRREEERDAQIREQRGEEGGRGQKGRVGRSRSLSRKIKSP